MCFVLHAINYSRPRGVFYYGFYVAPVSQAFLLLPAGGNGLGPPSWSAQNRRESTLPTSSPLTLCL